MMFTVPASWMGSTSPFSKLVYICAAIYGALSAVFVVVWSYYEIIDEMIIHFVNSLPLSIPTIEIAVGTYSLINYFAPLSEAVGLFLAYLPFWAIIQVYFILKGFMPWNG